MNPDLGKPDLGKPDLEKPDLVKPDLGNSNLVKPDFVKPNLGNPDLKQLKGSVPISLLMDQCLIDNSAAVIDVDLTDGRVKGSDSHEGGASIELP